MRRSLTTAVLVTIVVSAAPRTIQAVEFHQPPGDAQQPKYVPGELIVKLKPEAGKQVTEALAAGDPPTNTGLAWLDALNHRYGVTKIEPVFPNQPDPEAIKRKYPQRARRAPPGAVAPNLAHIYKLTLRKDADILNAAVDYGLARDVEYAEPNYVVTTQGAVGAAPP